jgi:hypothetical protein
VEVRYHQTVSDAERAEVQAWVAAHESDDLRAVTVDIGMVVIHDARGHSGISTHYDRSLRSALDEAFVSLRER